VSPHGTWWTDAIALEFGHQVRIARKRQGVSLKELAFRVYGRPDFHSLVCRVERGRRHGISTDLALRYCRALRLDVRDALWLVDALQDVASGQLPIAS
jgi:transcriptional regulator with XRE-family HTH domain